MPLDHNNPFVRESLEAMESVAIEQLAAEDFRDWRRRIREADNLQECSEITTRMLGQPLNDSERRVAHEALRVCEIEAAWRMGKRPASDEPDAPAPVDISPPEEPLSVKEMNRITKEVVLGIKAPKHEADQAAAFRKGVKKEIRQTAKMAKKLGINYTVELLSDW